MIHNMDHSLDILGHPESYCGFYPLNSYRNGNNFPDNIILYSFIGIQIFSAFSAELSIMKTHSLLIEI